MNLQDWNTSNGNFALHRDHPPRNVFSGSHRSEFRSCCGFHSQFRANDCSRSYCRSPQNSTPSLIARVGEFLRSIGRKRCRATFDFAQNFFPHGDPRLTPTSLDDSRIIRRTVRTRIANHGRRARELPMLIPWPRVPRLEKSIGVRSGLCYQIDRKKLSAPRVSLPAPNLVLAKKRR